MIMHVPNKRVVTATGTKRSKTGHLIRNNRNNSKGSGVGQPKDLSHRQQILPESVLSIDIVPGDMQPQYSGFHNSVNGNKLASTEGFISAETHTNLNRMVVGNRRQSIGSQKSIKSQKSS